LEKIIHPEFASGGFQWVVDFFLLVHFRRCIQSFFVFSGFKNNNLLLQKHSGSNEKHPVLIDRPLKTRKTVNLLCHNIRERPWA
jgi:hypothetical protein